MKVPLLSQIWRTIILLLAKILPIIVESLKPKNDDTRHTAEGNPQ